MPVLVIADTTGVTPEMHDGMLAALADTLRQAKGFISHTAGPHEDGWRVMEIWETKEDASRWFADYVHPNLPPGVRPRRTFHELHAIVLR